MDVKRVARRPMQVLNKKFHDEVGYALRKYQRLSGGGCGPVQEKARTFLHSLHVECMWKDDASPAKWLQASSDKFCDEKPPGLQMLDVTASSLQEQDALCTELGEQDEEFGTVASSFSDDFTEVCATGCNAQSEMPNMWDKADPPSDAENSALAHDSFTDKLIPVIIVPGTCSELQSHHTDVSWEHPGSPCTPRLTGHDETVAQASMTPEKVALAKSGRCLQPAPLHHDLGEHIDNWAEGSQEGSFDAKPHQHRKRKRYKEKCLIAPDQDACEQFHSLSRASTDDNLMKVGIRLDGMGIGKRQRQDTIKDLVSAASQRMISQGFPSLHQGITIAANRNNASGGAFTELSFPCIVSSLGFYLLFKDYVWESADGCHCFSVELQNCEFDARIKALDHTIRCRFFDSCEVTPANVSKHFQVSAPT